MAAGHFASNVVLLPSSSPSPIFGIALSSLPDSALVPDIFVPKVVYDCVEYLRKNAMRCKGLFRMSGFVQKQNIIRDKVDRGIAVIFGDDAKESGSDCHTVADLLKRFLRELPEPPIPDTVFSAYKRVTAADGGSGTSLSVSHMARLVDTTLPPLNYNLLKYLCQFLNNVSLFRDENEMDAYNLAVIFTPNLLRLQEAPCPAELVKVTTNWAKAEVAFVKNLIESADFIFCHSYQLPSRAHMKVVAKPPPPAINMSTPIGSEWDEVFAPLKQMRSLAKPSSAFRPVKLFGHPGSRKVPSEFAALASSTSSLPKVLPRHDLTSTAESSNSGSNKDVTLEPKKQNAAHSFLMKKMSQSLDVISAANVQLRDGDSVVSVSSSSTTNNTASSGDLLSSEEGGDVRNVVHTKAISTCIGAVDPTKTGKLKRDYTLWSHRFGHV